MQQQTERILAALCLVGAIAAVAPTASASLVAPAERTELACTLTADKDLIVQPTSTQLGVRSTDSLPGTLKAEFASGSRITVDSISRDMGSNNSFKVSANTSQATAGKWQLTVTNGTTACTGDVTVTSGNEE